jgi:hypothetical protein
MIRLVNNDYRGPDIVSIQSWFRGCTQPPVTGVQMNQVLRDSLRRAIPSFKTADGGYKGKPDRNLYTDQLRPGKYVEETRSGYVVPTFDELLKGLKYLPTGLDARELTQCLVWYLNVRDMFSPQLELNVLHAQSLIRALRQPLRAHGQRNLDKIALEEWKRNGQFLQKEVESEATHHERLRREAEEPKKSTMEVNLDNEMIKFRVSLPIRHVFMFPFLAMVGMAAKGMEIGVAKAEEHRAARLLPKDVSGEDSVTGICEETTGTPTKDAKILTKRTRREISPSYRIPKRSRPT